jgi:oligosaccharide repeat unit polymerase
MALLSTVILSLATGGREQAICYIVATAICYLIIRIRTGNQVRLTPKTVIIAMAIIAVLIVGFLALAVARGVQQSVWDYVAEYLGAEIYNLDHFLNVYTPHKILTWGGMTFVNLLNFIGDKLHIATLNYQLDLPFLSSNGYDMGNVYTTFYAFVYDFGYMGVPVLTAIMAVVSQVVYEMASRAARPTHADFWITIYAFLAFQLLFCFFSNKFYENAFGDSALRLLVYVFIGRTLLLYCNRSGFAAARSWVERRATGGTEKDERHSSKHLKD